MKSKRTLETVINYCDVELLINFTIEGKHTAATYEEPADCPEVEIKKVFAGDVDISEIFLEIQWEDIYQLLINKLEL